MIPDIAPILPDELPRVRAVLRQAYGWDDARERFAEQRLRRYHRAQPDGWFALRARRAADSREEIAAAGGCFVFSRVAFFGLVGVAPAFQRRGLARALMEHLFAFADAHGAVTLLLDASAAGAPLYESMGFRTIDQTQVYTRTTSALARPASSRVRVATPEDHREIAAMDASAYGGDRAHLIAACLDDGRAFVHADGGFCIAQGTHVGPIVAGSRAVASDLLDAALSGDFAREPEIYTHESHGQMRRVLGDHGFTHVRSLQHMERGEARGERPMVFGQQSLATG